MSNNKLIRRRRLISADAGVTFDIITYHHDTGKVCSSRLGTWFELHPIDIYQGVLTIPCMWTTGRFKLNKVDIL